MTEEQKKELLEKIIENLKLVIDIAYNSGKIDGYKESLEDFKK